MTRVTKFRGSVYIDENQFRIDDKIYEVLQTYDSEIKDWFPRGKCIIQSNVKNSLILVILYLTRLKN